MRSYLLSWMVDHEGDNAQVGENEDAADEDGDILSGDDDDSDDEGED